MVALQLPLPAPAVAGSWLAVTSAELALVSMCAPAEAHDSPGGSAGERCHSSVAGEEARASVFVHLAHAGRLPLCAHRLSHAPIHTAAQIHSSAQGQAHIQQCLSQVLLAVSLSPRLAAACVTSGTFAAVLAVAAGMVDCVPEEVSCCGPDGLHACRNPA